MHNYTTWTGAGGGGYSLPLYISKVTSPCLVCSCNALCTCNSVTCSLRHPIAFMCDPVSHYSSVCHKHMKKTRTAGPRS